MLAKRIPTISEPLKKNKMRCLIHSVAGCEIYSSRSKTPFRSPHHAVAGMIGGGNPAFQVRFAHKAGALLDELPGVCFYYVASITSAY